MKGRHFGRAVLAILVGLLLACGGGKGYRDIPFLEDEDAPDAEVGTDAVGRDVPFVGPEVITPVTESTDCHPDQDGDGYPVRSATPLERTAKGGCPAGTAPIRSTLGGDLLDCDDDDRAVHPVALEDCNGKDDDCDGTTDGTLGPECWEGCVGYRPACVGGAWEPCVPPDPCCEGSVRDVVTCLPAWWVVLIDSSSTMTLVDPQGLRFEGVRRALERLDEGRVTIATFGEAVATWSVFATPPAQAIGWLGFAQASGNGGGRDLDGAIRRSMTLFPQESLRRVVLVVTGGQDIGNGWDPHAVRLEAQAAHVRIAVVGVGPDADPTAMGSLAERSSDVVLVTAAADLEQATTDLLSRINASEWTQCADGAWEQRTGVCGYPSRDCVDPACDGVPDCVPDPAALDGKPCDDGNPCSFGDVCRGLYCTGSVLICDDGNDCTEDLCDPSTLACSYRKAEEGSPCPDDGLSCTGDVCVQGVCTHPNAQFGTPCPGANECMDATCDGKGSCKFQFGPQEGRACADEGNPCTKDLCGGDGTCHHDPAGTDGKPCDDGDLCTAMGACTGGTCVAGAAKHCQNDCYACNPGNGECEVLSDGSPCQDGLMCTIGDQCLAGICRSQPKVCDDGNPCTADFCIPGNGSCGTDAVPLSGTTCDDGVQCTATDRCQAGACRGVATGCPTYGDVQPILAAKCAGCHGGPAGCTARTCFVDAYPGPGTPATGCPGATLDRCIALRVANGSMPVGGVCTGDPAKDAGQPKCLTAGEQGTIREWNGGGGQP